MNSTRQRIKILLFILIVVSVMSGKSIIYAQHLPKIMVSESKSNGYVTGCRFWKCPKCGRILEKRALGKVWNIGDPIWTVAGTGTCSNCGSKFPQAEIYGGKYDVEEKVKTKASRENIKKASVILFQLSSPQPPTNPKEICLQFLEDRYPSAKLDHYYVIGFQGSLTIEEAYILYREYVDVKQLPDLGEQFDGITGKDITGKSCVVLFFK